MNYVKKQEKVEAIQYSGSNYLEVLYSMPKDHVVKQVIYGENNDITSNNLIITNKEDSWSVKCSDYIVVTDKTLIVMSDKEFCEKYEVNWSKGGKTSTDYNKSPGLKDPFKHVKTMIKDKELVILDVDFDLDTRIKVKQENLDAFNCICNKLRD